MRIALIGLASLASLFAQGTLAAAQEPPPDRIEAVYHPDSMFWSIEDGGTGRFRTSEREDYTFSVTREDYRRIARLMRPYRESGLRCDDPDYLGSDGYLVFREAGIETRRPHESLCYTDAARAAGRSLSRAYYAMEEMGEARHVPPPLPVLPDPDRLTFTSLYWGRTVQEWSIPRGGEGRWSQADGRSEAFAVSEAEFDRLRELFRPYEGVPFECQRVIADGPYGTVTWSQEGHEDQQLRWDAGCVTGDAADVFRRWDAAEALLKELRDR